MTLCIEVEPGDKHTGKHVSVGLWGLIDSMPIELWPIFIRVDVSFGSETIMHESEERKLHYLAKLRLTNNVIKLIKRLIDKNKCGDAGQGSNHIEPKPPFAKLAGP